MRNNALTMFVSAALVAIVGISCNRAKKVGNETMTIRVGAVLPLSGALASYGKNANEGIRLAAEQLSKQNVQVAGRTLIIHVVIEDSKGEPQPAVSAIQKLVTADNVSCVLGDVASSATLAMAPVANKNHVLLMSPAASAPAVTEAGEYVFRVWPSDAFEASVVANYMHKKPYRKIAVLYVNNDYGQAMRRNITSAVQGFGATIAVAEAFQQNATDIRAQLTKLSAAKPEVLFLISYPKDSVLALRQYSELGLQIPIVSTSSFEDPQILKEQGKVAEGVVYTSPLPAEESDPIVSGFRESYEAKYSKKPGLVADYAYDALRVLIEAAILGGGVDGDNLRIGLRKVKDFKGASGLINFDANGDVIKPAGLKTVKNGEYIWLK